MYNKVYHEIKDCVSIPQSIKQDNTILMIERSDECCLRFLFQVFDYTKGKFNYTSILAPTYRTYDLDV